MDEISALSREIEFHEKFRGYDPDEVEAYVDRVRKTAALALGRITELHQRAEAAEALIAAGRVDSAEETLGRALLLAQQTADDLVSEATAEAERLTVQATERVAKMTAEAQESSAASLEQARVEAEALRRDADDVSSRILAEAETDRRDMVRRAELEAEAEASEARLRLESDVAGLSRTRDFLSDDIDILEGHVEAQRAKLEGIVASLRNLVEDPETFRLEPAPATSGVVVDVVEDSEESPTEGEPVTSVETLLVEAEAPVLEAVPDEALDGRSELGDRGDEVIDLDQTERFDPKPEDAGAELMAEIAPPSPPRLMTAADLDVEPSDEASIDPGPPTAPTPLVAGEPLFVEATAGEGSLFTGEMSGLADGDLLAADSDALSAFFDQEDGDIDRSWFGRKG